MTAPPNYLDPSDPFYDAFRRSDFYGTRGRRPIAPLEWLRLTLLATLLLPVKLLAATLLILGYNLICRLSFLFPSENRADNVVAAGKLCSRLALLSMGFNSVRWEKDDTPYKQQVEKEKGTGVKKESGKVEETNGFPEGHPAVGAIVSNHISYIDILVHMTHSFPSFVARGNTKDQPLVGLISQHLQCIFVDREFKKGDVKGVSGQVKARMELAASGKSPPDLRPLLLFPEGTTTNGTCLLPFKTGAFLAGVPVQPVLLRYGPDKFSPAWESVDALWHAFLLLANPFHSVTATELPIYVPSQAEKEDPKLYASNVRDALLKAGGMQPSEASLVDSRAYIALLDGKPPPPHSRAGQVLAEQGGEGKPGGGEKKVT